ncbi:MAG: phytoene desaturase family protein [Candidatus Methylacidiphilales bacterium]
MATFSRNFRFARRICVIGGGLGGLAAALRLRQCGHKVTLIDKNPRFGGKLAEKKEAGYRWDLGPSLLTMPEVLRELFTDLGKNLTDYLELVSIEPTCRYFWPDGFQIDEDAAFFQRPDVASFLRYAAGIYALSGEAFLHRPPHELWRAFAPKNWAKLIHLPKVATFATVAQEVERRLTEPHIQQLFLRFATYNGSSPYRAPATFNVIPYVEATFGGWYIRGGMARLPEALTRLAETMGVELIPGAEVKSLDGGGARLTSGDVVGADAYLCNGCVIEAHRRWIRFPGWEEEARRLARPERALSGFVLLLGVDRRFPKLSHHNIFFSADYPAEFRQMFQEKRPADDPTIYVSITARTDSEDAPEGHDNYFVLVNAPAEIKAINWDKEGPAYADRIVAKLESAGLSGLSSAIRTRHLLTPFDFANRDLSAAGSLYGWASHSPHTALLRPPMRSRLDPRLTFVGGTTHPGGGIPLVLLSAKMAAHEVEASFAANQR